MVDDLQTPFDVGVVMVTIVRPTLAQALRSIYTQRFAGRIQVLIGIDRWEGEPSVLDQLIGERPPNVCVTVIDLGYSTSKRNGGLYPSGYGGALKSILSYAANSRYVAYLDDDNWYAPDHLGTMLAAISGKDWAFSLRFFVDAPTGEMLCPDTWESVGPGRGVYASSQGGFVDTNCFLIDKLACHDVFTEWAMTRYAKGTGGDRQILQRIRDRPWGTNAAHTVYYRQHLVGHHPYLLWRFRCAGIALDRFMPPAAIPGEAMWQKCAEFDRQQGTNDPTG
ncbi:MAG: glycosyltransferase family 2 protein [Betaproteobacteria bacterium]